MIFHSPSPSVEIPKVSWPEYFFTRIASYHDQIALIDGLSGQITSFDDLKKSINSIEPLAKR
jgi:regulator of sirC expression with transglutaminase-like and TPR domain